MSLIRRTIRQEFTLQHLTLLGVAITFLLLLAACGPAATPDSTPIIESDQNLPVVVSEAEGDSGAESTGEAAYPPPVTVEIPGVEEAYPVIPPPPIPTTVPESYPSTEEVFAEPRFRFDGPLKAGSTTVSGQAPPDLALAIVDITFNGVLLGTGVSDADGRFTIGVSPLPDGNRVGVTFAELQPGKTLADMSYEYFPHRGENFMNLPNVGIYFETALVEP